MEQAKEELEKLKQTHLLKQIFDAMKPNKMVTGGRMTEGAFIGSLNEKERALYDRAKEERLKIFQRFVDMEK